MPTARAKTAATLAARNAQRAAYQAASQAALTENVPFRSPFTRLVNEIRDIFESNDDIAANDPRQKQIQEILRKHRSNEQAWHKYAFQDPNLPFTRNLVADQIGKYNLVKLREIFETKKIGGSAFASWFLCGVPRGRARFRIMLTPTI